MKMDLPETEAWRRKRADELGFVTADPWRTAHPRDARVDVAPMRAPDPSPPEPEPEPEPERPRPVAAERPVRRPVPAPAPAPAATPGGTAKASAIVAGLLFAVAAGWQARDFLDAPAPDAPPRAQSRPAPLAVPPAEAPRCDDPAVVAALRDRVAGGIVREGGDPAWSVRVAAEARVTLAPPSVTSLESDGARFCGTRLTIVPPGTRKRLSAPVTYRVGPRGALTDVQGDVGTVRRLVALGTPPAEPVPAPVSKPVPAKPGVVRKAQPDAEAKPAERASSTKAAAKPEPKGVPSKSEPKGVSAKPGVVRQARPDAGAKTPERAASQKATAAPPVTAPPMAVAKTDVEDSTTRVCGDVWSRAEGMVCATPALKARHRALTAVLDRILLGGDAVTIKRAVDGQRRFLARRDRCDDDACVARRYDDRLADLTKIEAKRNVP